VIKLLVKLIEEGPGVHYKGVNFPSYANLNLEINSFVCTIDVLDTDVPASIKQRSLSTVSQHGVMLEVIVPIMEDKEAWEAIIRDRYQERFSAWNAESVIP